MFDLKQLFGLAPTPEQKTKECKLKLRKLQRELEQQIRDVERATTKTTREIKLCAKRNDQKSARALAKEIVQARKAIEKLYTSKARASSVERALTRRAATQTSVKTLERSSEVLKAMNALVKVSAVRDQARELSREMTRAGIMEELVEEALADDLEDKDETERAIEDILKEIAGEVVLPDTGVEEKVTREATIAVEPTTTTTTTTTTTEDLKARLERMRPEA